ncbi:thioredoxin domain-containing protein [Bacillus chungangensis]|uniref:Uncharacterized protein YyaL (SSP411 family) n=1 Tax=Bacillus chungangensis TaxID=587633 RepID=A0ABT9WQF0_9BACI|nr:thioredoxin domain-containing protein [Bacillus chungangensis]MDQ0175509.1 uncharacterized protein YyaL (SSP411 family) [Bacillus chungangensis]
MKEFFDKQDRKANHLINSKSPYLIQHAYNPVQWYEWESEAFEKAKKENKPIFLSIGYSTCHWCHVMEKESFEDEEVAELLNKHFVAIKVDREERPDIDSIYMTVCQMLTGQGGWPLTVFLTPEQKPFYAGTYFPKHSQYGRPGMMDVLTQLHEKYEQEKEKIAAFADKITSSLTEQSKGTTAAEIPEKVIHQAYQQVAQQFDSIYGGFGQAPKFPTPHKLLFLLRYHHWTGTELALTMVEKTLHSMVNGGIYDHIGGGFARYATDEQWLVPHFEKMLYDNALLLHVLTEAYQLTREPRWKKIAFEVIAFIKREMMSPEGAFYSAIDADSEGVEGKYYVWSKAEVVEILGDEDGELFADVYDITEEGNFEGKNIPNLIYTQIHDDNLKDKLEVVKHQLLKAREKRVYPHLDDKILTAWNGLMIGAIAKAGAVFQAPDFIDAAEKAAAFIEKELWKEGQLFARYRDGEAKFHGYVDDYAFLLWGYIELYEATGSIGHLQKALQLREQLFSRFWDDERGGFFFTDKEAEVLITREKQSFDDAMPSGNNVAALQLWRLSKLTGEETPKGSLKQLFGAFQQELDAYPSGLLSLMEALMATYAEGKEIVVTGYDQTKRQTFLNELHAQYQPFAVWIEATAESRQDNQSFYWHDQITMDKPFVVYICEHYMCQQPHASLQAAIDALQSS